MSSVPPCTRPEWTCLHCISPCDPAAAGPLTLPPAAVQWSLSEGAGARKLAEVRTRAAIQLLLVQACGEIFTVHGQRLSLAATSAMLDVLQQVADHGRAVDSDAHLRRTLAVSQAEDKVGGGSLHVEGPVCGAVCSD